MKPNADREILPILTIILLFFTLSACSKEPVQENFTQTLIPTKILLNTSTPEQNVVEPSKIVTEAIQPFQSPTSTVQPTPADSPNQTVPSNVDFTINSASRELPENLMDQITFFGEAGGGGGDFDPCEEAPRGVPSYLYELQTETCLYCDFYIATCGWVSNEKVRITVQLKGRGSYKTTEQANKYGYLQYILSATADDFPGDYTVAFSGKNGKLKTTFFKIAPIETGTFLDGDQLILYNFIPLEKFRLTVYQDNSTNNLGTDLKFIGWQDYQIDANGALRIQIDWGSEIKVRYQIEAEKSGLFPRWISVDSKTGKESVYYPNDFKCRTNETFLVAKNGQVRVKDPEGAPLYRTLQEDMYFKDPDRILKQDQTAKIISGPYCFGYTIYWSVELSDKSVGWIQQSHIKVLK